MAKFSEKLEAYFFNKISNEEPQTHLAFEVREYNHYFKNVSHLNYIDIYRIFILYNVTNPCVQHAVKKLLLPGGRGEKDFKKDLMEARDSLNRALEILEEDKDN